MQHITHRATSQPKAKLKVVEDYNQCMLGVDKLDQLASYYSFPHKSVKWWRKVFFWCVEVTAVNSYIIYKEQAQKHGEQVTTHLGYRRQLIEFLFESIRSNAVPRPCKLGRSSAQHLECLQTCSSLPPEVDSLRPSPNSPFEYIVCVQLSRAWGNKTSDYVHLCYMH